MSKFLNQAVEPNPLPFQHKNMKLTTTDYFNNEVDGGDELISINIIPTMAKQRPQNSHKRKKSKKTKKTYLQHAVQTQKSAPDIVVQHSQSSVKVKTPQKASAEKLKKHVRFAEKLDNDSSLDSSMRERIEHNLKYNDDTIFDGISIF